MPGATLCGFIAEYDQISISSVSSGSWEGPAQSPGPTKKVHVCAAIIVETRHDGWGGQHDESSACCGTAAC